MSPVDAASLSWVEVAARLAVAIVAGAVIGLEREVEGKEAGTRTHMLLALGAATFGVVSVGGFSEFAAASNQTNVTIDVTRVASYVAAGVGFLAGGVILKRESGIQGLTTAASLWTAAAAGLAAGLGLWAGAVIAAGLSTLILVADRPISWFAGKIRRADE